MSLREERQRLIDREDLRGTAFCRAYSDVADDWLTGLFDRSTEGDTKGLALVAVGGYGRQELYPASDLDVVLIHRGRRDVSAMANRIWYPVWDEGISLDHSVRRPGDALELAGKDLRTALGLLDGRVVCGDPKVVEPMLERGRDHWAKQRPPWLDDLRARVAERHAAHGDVAFLLEPDLKESHGGLRDIAALVALMQAVPELADYVDMVAVDSAHEVLARLRVELHRRSERELNRVLLQEQDGLASALSFPDADALMGSLAAAGRTVAWESDDAWRRRHARANASNSRRSRSRGAAEGASALVASTSDSAFGTIDGEVALAADAPVTADPGLALRLAAFAAQGDLPIARQTLNALGRKAPAPDEPWSDALRATLVRLLATGQPAISVVEALDQRGAWSRYLPEWQAVRNKPQRNPYHRFTVDRHLLEATANAALLVTRVTRPDLLLVGTLLHDLGKGFKGDHTEVGMRLAVDIGTRWGFDTADVTTLFNMVRLHLLLPEMATRRDLDDPATAVRVATEVGDRPTLELLAAMVEADSLATGSSAWSSWKAGLIADLTERTVRILDGQRAQSPETWLSDEHRAVMETVRTRGAPAVAVDDPTVTVIARDRPGLLAEVTGVLALHGLDVRSATVDGEDGVAVEVFTVEPSRGRWPRSAQLADDLGQVIAGTLALEERLAERARTYRNARSAITPHLVTTQVTVDNDASEGASVVEVRAEDLIGQLHRITRALADCHLDVISAKVSTFGPAVVDAFYVRGPDGGKLIDAKMIREIEATIHRRIVEHSDI